MWWYQEWRGGAWMKWKVGIDGGIGDRKVKRDLVVNVAGGDSRGREIA